ncbi:MAG: DNA polymerase IV [Candidatus Magasanikbacteria bacterium]
MTKLFSLQSFPRAILHIDGDCFFASCEMAKNPALRGKPIITGVERGIASSMSYEAKALGIKRGMPLHEMKKLCPDIIFVPSDYETYSLYSFRLYNIVRRYTASVEEYSIDECFAELTGMRRPLHMSYEQMAYKIKEDLDKELGMTFSVGLAPTKVLAKLASKWKKPSGCTIIKANEIQNFLRDTDIDKIWGIGKQTTAYLRTNGIYTALEFAKKDWEWIDKNMTKPHKETWKELRGELINELDKDKKSSYRSISKTKTFTPPSTDRSYVFSQLSKNIENACIKARRYNLHTKKIFFFLKTQDFKYNGLELKLSNNTNNAVDILRVIKEKFSDIFKENTPYRATGIFLLDLDEEGTQQLDLFSHQPTIERFERLLGSLDEMAKKYGKHTVFLGSSLKAMQGAHKGERATKASRKYELFKGETERKRLNIPYLGLVV